MIFPASLNAKPATILTKKKDLRQIRNQAFRSYINFLDKTSIIILETGPQHKHFFTIIYQETWFVSWKGSGRYTDKSERSETEFVNKVNKQNFRKYDVKMLSRKKLNLIHVTNFLKRYCVFTIKLQNLQKRRQL